MKTLCYTGINYVWYVTYTENEDSTVTIHKIDRTHRTEMDLLKPYEFVSYNPAIEDVDRNVVALLLPHQDRRVVVNPRNVFTYKGD